MRYYIEVEKVLAVFEKWKDRKPYLYFLFEQMLSEILYHVCKEK